jgi:glycosyltransferase involved in cell wall biosynthesis
MSAPQVSVVMSVYNGAATLRESVQSVLSQQGVDFEFIIVDDGSTDASAGVLDEFARADHRIRVIHQENRGLTLALIRGCAAATGEYIARQDCGDVSLPGRLRAELRVMDSSADVVLVSCGTRYVGPAGERLYEVSIAGGDATDGLMALDIKTVRGPAHHGSTLFRRELYVRVGGYREQFYFAQDLDLWTRLVEHGRHTALAEVFYQATFALGSISSQHRRHQIACAKAILECAGLRRARLSEAPAIAKAAAIVPGPRTVMPADRAAALYFVGVCLRNRADPRARQYFRDALRANPLHLKSAVRLLMG